MNKLISKEERIHELTRFGAPELFINSIGKIPELQFHVENVDGAYFYLPQISNYEIIKNLNLIPIFSSGESFYVFTYDHQTQRIINFELENDEIYDDYGTNWNLLLMDIMIQYFESEIDDGIEISDFKSVGEKIDFDKAEKLFKLLDLPVEEYNAKYDEKEKWRIDMAKQLKIL